MLTISRAEWKGTEEELRAGVEAFRQELIAHARTVGIPAPWPSHPLFQVLSKVDDYTLEPLPEAPPPPEPTPPTPLQIIEDIEKTNPITHRALRELILTIGEAFPEAKDTVFYKRVKAVDDAIRAEREKL